MPNILDTNGLETATQTELVQNQTVGLQVIYGTDINLASSSPDGQWVNINVQAQLDTEDLITQVYNTFNPDNAIGVVLDQRVAINGIQRQGGTYTITNITLVLSQSVNLYGLDQSVNPVYTISDSAGNPWELISTILAATGTQVLAFQSAVIGAILTTPNTITVPVTIVLGVTSINNPTTYSILGVAQESDAALRIRRQKSVSISSQGYLGGLFAALENINGITSVQIYENDTNATSTGSVAPNVPAGIPSHTLWVIIAGNPTPALAPAYSSTVSYSYGNIASSGSVNYISVQNNNLANPVSNTAFWSVYNPIAQAIYAHRSSGCGLKGNILYTVIQIDGTPFLINWDVVSAQNLFIKFTAASLDGINAPNYNSIFNDLPTLFAPGADAEVNINQLATYVQEADPNTLVTNAGFSLLAGGFYTNTLSPSSPAFQFAVSAANTIILPIILYAPGITYVFNVNGTVANTAISTAHGGSTLQFATTQNPLGGYIGAGYSFTLLSGGGSIGASSGLYTSGIAGTDTVQVTDGLGNIATCVITVT